MKRFITPALRIALGAIFVLINLANVLHLMPAPAGYPPEAMAFGGALMNSGYFMPLVWGVQVVAGMALLLNLWTPLALAILAPVTINILLFHVFLTPNAIFTVGGPGILVFVLNVALLWAYRGFYRELLVTRARLA